MTITIGGQLSLCMLMGALIDKCGAEIVMCNTDGFEYYVDIDKIPLADKIVEAWEKLTGLVMEGDTYDTMYVRDVNNYISVTESGKIKTKGAYEVLPFDKLGFHKNHSSMVIPMAVLAYFTEGKDYKEFILNHKDMYDFFLRTKVPRSSRLVLVKDEADIAQQNICRYYPSEEGGYLVKIMPPVDPVKKPEDRRIGVDTEWKVETCNHVADFDWNKLNYEYYFTQAAKLISEIEGEKDSEKNDEKEVAVVGFF